MNPKTKLVTGEDLRPAVEQHAITHLDLIHQELDRVLDLVEVLENRGYDAWARMERPKRIEHTLGGATKLIYE